MILRIDIVAVYYYKSEINDYMYKNCKPGKLFVAIFQ